MESRENMKKCQIDNRKFRHELKYECSDAELEILKSRLSGLLLPDVHGNDRGIYQIRSIYFDDRNDRCYSQNAYGVDPREKWRIRAYNCSDSRITLECKRKERGMTQKKSCAISREQYEQLLSPGFLTVSEENPSLLNRFILLRIAGYQPKVIVSYQRQALVHPLGNVRVTFDRNITSSPDCAGFFQPRISQRAVLPAGHQLLEVKYDEFLPDHIYHAIQMANMRRIAFSKYYLCRKFSL